MSDLESDCARESDDEEGQRGIHHLKSHPRSFEATQKGAKTFEVRIDDRRFLVDDLVVLNEWDPVLGASRNAEGYTGRVLRGVITCVLRAEDAIVRGSIGDGHVVLGIKWDHLR